MVIALLASAAWAQDVSVHVEPQNVGQTWSVIGPKTVTPGANVFEASAGYPAVSVGFVRGVSTGVNIGARLSFVYGFEGMLREAAPGLKVQGLFKLRLLDSGQVSLGLVFEPGIATYASYLQGARVNLALPVGLRFGIAASSALSVAVSLDFPMWVEFGTFGGFNFPILTGGGIEYFLTSQLVAFFRARIGPTLRTLGRPTEVTFESSVGIGYRF